MDWISSSRGEARDLFRNRFEQLRLRSLSLSIDSFISEKLGSVMDTLGRVVGRDIYSYFSGIKN